MCLLTRGSNRLVLANFYVGANVNVTLLFLYHCATTKYFKLGLFREISKRTLRKKYLLFIMQIEYHIEYTFSLLQVKMAALV